MLYFKLFRFISVFAFICVYVVSSMSAILPVCARSRTGLDPDAGSPIEDFLMYKRASYNGICDYKMCLRVEFSAGGCRGSGF